MTHLSYFHFLIGLAFAFSLASCDSSNEDTSTSPSTISESEIIFNSDKTGVFQIYRSHLSTSVEQQITNDSNYDHWWPRISPDRTKVLYHKALTSAGQDYGQSEIWVSSPDGSNPQRVLAVGDHGWTLQAHAEWSLDGEKILICAAISGVLHIATTDAAGQNA